MDFFFWEYAVNIEHSERMESLPDLGQGITAAFAAVPVDMLYMV
jgi:hypothetical protein